MTIRRLETRVVKLERAGASWRAYEGRPLAEWPDLALVAYLSEREGWPRGHVPSDAELQAIAARTGVAP